MKEENPNGIHRTHGADALRDEIDRAHAKPNGAASTAHRAAAPAQAAAAEEKKKFDDGLEALREEMAQPDSERRTVFIAASEGDCETLRGWNCLAVLPRRWSDREITREFCGADAVVLDNNQPVAASLRMVARRVRVLPAGKAGDGSSDEFFSAVERLPPLPPSMSPPLRLAYFDDLSTAAVRKAWLIKNVMARGESSSWIAQPGMGKSALLTDAAVYLAAGLDWRGHRVKEKAGIVILAFERADLTKRRLVAYRRRDGLTSLPIAVADKVVDLMDKSCVDIILATIFAAEQRFGIGVGLVVIDTYSKGIAAGGGDEDKAKDQNIVQANMHRLLDRGCIAHIAGIGHTGKDEKRGERGSNARLAGVDLQVQIAGTAVKTVRATKANDQDPGATITTFAYEPFDFGTDEDGDACRTLILGKDAPAADEAVTDTRGKKRGVRKLSNKQILALDALTEVTLSQGRNPPAEFELPAGVKVVDADEWRQEMIRANVFDRDSKNLRARFAELRDRLSTRRLIGSRDDLVWRATAVTQGSAARSI